MSQDSEDIKRILRAGPESEESDVGGLFERSLEAKHAAFIGWVVAAGCYGYATALYQDSMPESAWLFFLFGAAIATGMAGSLAMTAGDDE